MGSLIGHLVPGTFFFLYATWHAFSITYRFHKSWRIRDRFRSSATYNDFVHRRMQIPLEALYKMFAVAIGIALETYSSDPGGLFHDATNAQHATMYGFFFLAGLMDLLIYFGFPIPLDFDYVTMALAFVVEGLLFVSHTHGRSSMEIQVHQFLTYTIVGCVSTTLWEIGHKANPLASLTRTFFILWHGSWYIAAGFILYPPSKYGQWDQENHSQMMIVTDLFAATAGGVVVFLIAIYWAMLECVRRHGDVLDQVSAISGSEYARLEAISKPTAVQVLPPAVSLDTESDEEVVM